MNLEKILGSLLLSVVKALVIAGLPSTKALQYATFIVLENAFGREITASLGISSPTARRIRQTIRELDLQPLEDEELTAEIQNELATLMTGIEDLTRDGRVMESAAEIEKIMKEKGWS